MSSSLMPALPASADLFLAHRAPLLLLQELIQLDETSATCTVRTADDGLLAKDGYFETVLAVEWMAQTVGVFVGAARLIAGEKPRIGFIIACPDVSFHVERIPVNTPVVVQVSPIWVEESSGSFNCYVRHAEDNTLLAEGRLSAHEPNL